MLNRLKVISDDNGFVLKEIQEMKWRNTFQSTASKEMIISKKNGALRAGENDYNANGDEKSRL